MNVRELLDEAYERFAVPGFVEADHIQVPRHFARREDAETIGFLTATLAWGQRAGILRSAWRLVELMDHAPHDFVLHSTPADMRSLRHFVHRTFNAEDLRCFIRALRRLYTMHGELERAFLPEGTGLADKDWNALHGIQLFRQRFLGLRHPERTRKHVADPGSGSSAKRINMFLRWMVRPGDRGVDLGLWHRLRTAQLMVPLDVHTGRVARELGLLQRRQDDRRAVEELTTALRHYDPEDPVKYDIALFGLGVSAKAISR